MNNTNNGLNVILGDKQLSLETYSAQYCCSPKRLVLIVRNILWMSEAA